ncbi:glycerol-3-phosphate 1-O-acyltransferase PlsY [Alkalicoccobacillus porphyridii]|uniref:Glycerol-3-phosphate acyltransferase n=1 Tax=Alkalicoccobacillus porphyridii TaxID=2597270 RepID=A0A553ZZM4_9BACI|nr:glycerol-3-phosphate 1-O-acyltransferase PlsY [Alkalicoccobacillus porphyridii]TSB46900.1 glycerol-3-phosphate 1-O-acyltransferase PlsY [Alkalicoccobacillus porphyridii]
MGVALLVSITIGYLLGSISFSYLIGRKLLKLDIRTMGSGNAGATNTLRVMGKGPAISVLALDIAKGIAAVWIGVFIGSGNDLVPALAGLAAILGHNWPIYFGFRGGKGAATTIGVIATLVFIPALIAGVVAIASIFITRYVSLGSLLFVILTPVTTWLLLSTFDYPIEFFYLTLAVALLSLWKHRTNIHRLASGSENKLGSKKEA